MKNSASAFAVAWALVAAPAAYAQTTPSPVPSTAAADESVGVEDIIVTASRREERLQDVPISVTALNANMLAERGVSRTFDLAYAVPGLSVNRSSQTVVYFLRGVGNGTIVPGSDPSVASYIDGVYQSFPNGATLALNNVERVEVLKGPQGTLFGRNATGGLIQVITKTPTNEPEAEVSVGYGRFNTFTSSAYVSGGIGIVAADLAISYSNQSEGWGKNLFTPAQAGNVLVNGAPITVPDVSNHEAGINRDVAVASKFVISPTDDLTLKLSGQHAYNKSDQGLYVNYLPGSRALIIQTGQTVPFQSQGSFWDWNSNTRDIGTNSQTLLSADVSYTAKAFSLRSITAYIDAKSDPVLYSPAVPTVENQGASQTANPRVPVETFSQEVQALSPTGSSLQWIAGAYFSTSKTGYLDLPFYRGNFIEKVGVRHAESKTETYAAFAQATAELGSATKVTGGLRYTHDKLGTSQIFRGAQTSTGATPFSTVGAITNVVPLQTVSYNNVSYRASVDHHFNDDIMVFAVLNTGYKAGGYNVGTMCTTTVLGTCPAANIAPPVKPEKLTAYEGGFKSEFLDSKVRLNASAFYYDYTNLQVQSLVSAGIGGSLIGILNNAAKARIKGIDAELDVVPNRVISFNGAMEILDAKFRDFPNFVPSIPNPNAPFGNRSGIINAAGVFVPNGTINARGNDLTRAPRFTATVGMTIKVPVGEGDLRLNTNYYYNGGFYWESSNRVKEGSYGLLNAEAVYSMNDMWSLRVWAHNIANTKYHSFVDATAFGDRARPAAPATFGASIGFKM